LIVVNDAEILLVSLIVVILKIKTESEGQGSSLHWVPVVATRPPTVTAR